MKKLLPLLALLTSTLLSQAQQAGKMRISFAGFKCLRATNDDMLQMDGKGDEVFLTFYFTVAMPNGTTRLSHNVPTDVYGDATGHFSNRISAGSCTDAFGGAKGGIRDGDNFTINKVLAEYDMAAGELLTIVPTLWEWDNGSSFQGNFDATINGAFTTVNQRAINYSNTNLTAAAGGVGTSLLTSFVIDAGTSLSLKAFFNIVGELGPKTRPVGIYMNGDYSPKAVLLNGNIMQNIASSNFGYGPGVIPVQYNEEALGNSRDHGNYIILLKVDFTPKAGSPAPAPAPSHGTPPPPPNSSSGYVPPPAPGTMTSTVSPTNPPANGAPSPTNPPAPPRVMMSPVSQRPALATANLQRVENTRVPNLMTGTWTGTVGNGTATGPGAFTIQLNADGNMQVLAANGAVIGSGNYTSAANTFNGKYTYTNTTGQISLQGTLSNSILSGSWSAGNGGGKWTLHK